MFYQVLKAQDPPINLEVASNLKVLKTQCIACRWRNGDGVTCEAFPKGIPAQILAGAYDHTAPYDVDGVDDGGLTFDPI